MRVKNKYTRIIILSAVAAGIFGYWNFAGHKDYAVFKAPEKQEARREEPAAANSLPELADKIATSGATNNKELLVEDEPASSTEKSIDKNILFKVPFTAQAPLGEWSDPRQQDGCEEAAVLMAMRWASGKTAIINKKDTKQEILAIADYEEKNYGSYHDTSAADTVARIIKGYFNYDKASVKYNIDAAGIKQELENGNLVLVPANGRALGNPNFTLPGPDRHMLVIKGYDFATDEFITNDPGTRNGENYRYKPDVLIAAIRDYPTGNHLPIMEKKKAMIVVGKQ